MSLDKYKELNNNVAKHVSALYQNSNIRDLQNSFGEGGSLRGWTREPPNLSSLDSLQVIESRMGFLTS